MVLSHGSSFGGLGAVNIEVILCWRGEQSWARKVDDDASRPFFCFTSRSRRGDF